MGTLNTELDLHVLPTETTLSDTIQQVAPHKPSLQITHSPTSGGRTQNPPSAIHAIRIIKTEKYSSVSNHWNKLLSSMNNTERIWARVQETCATKNIISRQVKRPVDIRRRMIYFVSSLLSSYFSFPLPLFAPSPTILSPAFLLHPFLIQNKNEIS